MPRDREHDTTGTAEALDLAETCEALWSVARRLKDGWEPRRYGNEPWYWQRNDAEEVAAMTAGERAVIETLNDGDEK